MAEGKTRDKEQIRQELVYNRLLIDSKSRELQKELTVANIVKHSIARRPYLIIGGIFIGGAVLAKILLPSRKKIEYPNIIELPDGYAVHQRKKSIFSTIGKVGLSLALPVVKPYLSDLIKQHLLSTLKINNPE